jgi:hypothetical protein
MLVKRRCPDRAGKNSHPITARNSCTTHSICDLIGEFAHRLRAIYPVPRGASTAAERKPEFRHEAAVVRVRYRHAQVALTGLRVSDSVEERGIIDFAFGPRNCRGETWRGQLLR